jgi:hypothetical protein
LEAATLGRDSVVFGDETGWSCDSVGAVFADGCFVDILFSFLATGTEAATVSLFEVDLQVFGVDEVD